MLPYHVYINHYSASLNTQIVSQSKLKPIHYVIWFIIEVKYAYLFAHTAPVHPGGHSHEVRVHFPLFWHRHLTGHGSFFGHSSSHL